MMQALGRFVALEGSELYESCWILWGLLLKLVVLYLVLSLLNYCKIRDYWAGADRDDLVPRDITPLVEYGAAFICNIVRAYINGRDLSHAALTDIIFCLVNNLNANPKWL
jgi:hypothetical protein